MMNCRHIHCIKPQTNSFNNRKQQQHLSPPLFKSSHTHETTRAAPQTTSQIIADQMLDKLDPLFQLTFLMLVHCPELLNANH